MTSFASAIEGMVAHMYLPDGYGHDGFLIRPNDTIAYARYQPLEDDPELGIYADLRYHMAVITQPTELNAQVFIVWQTSSDGGMLNFDRKIESIEANRPLKHGDNVWFDPNFGTFSISRGENDNNPVKISPEAGSSVDSVNPETYLRLVPNLFDRGETSRQPAFDPAEVIATGKVVDVQTDGNHDLAGLKVEESDRVVYKKLVSADDHPELGIKKDNQYHLLTVRDWHSVDGETVAFLLWESTNSALETLLARTNTHVISAVEGANDNKPIQRGDEIAVVARQLEEWGQLEITYEASRNNHQISEFSFVISESEPVDTFDHPPVTHISPVTSDETQSQNRPEQLPDGAVPKGSTPTNPVDLVIAIDTSGSMQDEASALSQAAEAAIKAAESSCPSDLRVVWLGLEGTWPNTNFDRKVSDFLIKECAADESRLQILQSGQNSKDPKENGAATIDDIANHCNWRPNTARAILYLSDEAFDGSSTKVNAEAVNRTIEAAKSNQVAVHTYFGTSSDQNKEALRAEYTAVSEATKGRAFTDQDALDGFTDLLKTVICVTQEVAPEPTLPEPTPACVDLVVACDTSESMKDDAVGICQAVEAEIEKVRSDHSCDLRVVWLGLEGTWADTSCTRTVRDYLIKECGVKEADIRCRKLTPDTGSGPQEDGARTIEDLVNHFDWRPEATCNILYISDEGLDGGGTKVTKRAIEAADRAITMAQLKQVSVHTCFCGSTNASTQDIQAEYSRVSEACNGRAFASKSTLTGFANVLTTVPRTSKSVTPTAGGSGFHTDTPQQPLVAPSPGDDGNPLSDLLEELQQMMDQNAPVNLSFLSGSGYSFEAVSRLDVEQLQTYEESQSLLNQIQLDMENLQSSISRIMSSSIRSEDARALMLTGESTFREWLATVETAILQREEVQKSVYAILAELGAVLRRAQAAHRLFLTERDELWMRWTTLQHGELTESAKVLIKKEQDAKEAALAEARLLREEVASLKKQLASALLRLESVDVTGMRELEQQLHEKLREQRTFQAELQGINQRIQIRMADYESRLKRWQEREIEWQRSFDKQKEELQIERERLESYRRENARLRERVIRAESELQSQTIKLESEFVHTQTVKSQYVHKQQVRMLIKGVFDSFSRQIRELEQGAEQHEDALEARLAWTVRLNESLDMLAAQVSQFDDLSVGFISETTRTVVTTEHSESYTSSASASSTSS